MVTQRLGFAAKAWRVAAVLAGVVLVTRGSLTGNDWDWPFAPMSQFAFRIGPDDAVHSTFLQARAPGGELVKVTMSPGSIGMARAEVEGQLSSFQRDPAKLSALAHNWAQRHPGRTPMTEWYLLDDVTSLRDGQVAGERVDLLASWRPDGGPSQPVPGATPVTTIDDAPR